MTRAIAFGAAVALCSALPCGRAAAASSAGPPTAQKAVLTRFLTALRAKDYAAAFALLSKSEQTYFGTPENYGSGYVADRISLDTFRILSLTQTSGGTVAVVSEHLQAFSHKRQIAGRVSSTFAYGIVAVGGTLGIKDPYHPWRAIVPHMWTATTSGVTVDVRKISFFTGRVELLMTFANRSDATVTILPYGRSVVRDAAGAVHRPIETKLAGLTDAELYTGVLLAPGAQYTGAMTFFSADRFSPSALSATIAPLLADGADAPIALELPAYTLPR